MISIDCDLHIHGRYSGGTSQDMTVPYLSQQAPRKGLDVVASADALHTGWRKHLESHLSEESGLYTAQASTSKFIIQTEVEDVNRVHHVIFLPSLDAAADLYERLKPYSVNLDSDGRPNVRLGGPELVDLVDDVGGFMGPSHAFTPWTSMYKEHDSIADCYGDRLSKVRFLELGLSADTDLADRIGELKDLTFLTNSDCHSPWPHRLGREFNRMDVKDLSFDEIRKAIERKNNRGITLNVGLNPSEGKYHLTACSRCYLKFSWDTAVALKRRCPECNGLIKKGVVERINDLADTDDPVHPAHRPPYVHILPLAQVISLALGVKTLTSKKISAKWEQLVGRFGSEINILVDEDIRQLSKEDAEVARIIGLFRSGKMRYVAGGGGKYGYPAIRGEKDRVYSGDQKTLADY